MLVGGTADHYGIINGFAKVGVIMTVLLTALSTPKNSKGMIGT
jgi:hypothetical protein